MANVIYPLYKEALLDGSSTIDINDGTVKAALIDTGTYTYSASHYIFSQVSGVVGTPTEITNTTVDAGLFDGDDVTFNSVSGDTVEAIIIFIDTGTPSTSRLVAYLDTSITGLPVTPNGGDINVVWDASGIFQL